jgi:hypothetical protein
MRTKWRKSRGLKVWRRTFLGLSLNVIYYMVGSGSEWRRWRFEIGDGGVVDLGYGSLEGAQNAAEIRARLIRARP